MPLTGTTILAVDDNEMHSYAIARSMEVYGATVLQAHSGIDTLRIAREKHPDVILLDVNLPDIQGFHVCATLKADPVTSDIPVIFITSTYQTTSAKDEAEHAGGETLLFHPVEHKQLASIIQAHVRRSGRGISN